MIACLWRDVGGIYFSVSYGREVIMFGAALILLDPGHIFPLRQGVSHVLTKLSGLRGVEHP